MGVLAVQGSPFVLDRRSTQAGVSPLDLGGDSPDGCP